MYSVSKEISVALDGDGSVVVPGRHAAHCLRLAHSAEQLSAGRTLWRSPRILPWNSWIERLLRAAVLAEGTLQGFCPLSPAQERRLWQAASFAVTGSVDLALQAQRTASLISDYRLQAPEGLAGQVREAFLAACAARRCVSALHASEAQLETVASQVDSSVTFAGFACFTPRQRWLIDRLEGVGKAIGHAPRARMSGRGRIRVLDCAEPAQELLQAAHWCRNLLLEDPGRRVLVVSPDLDRDRPLLRRAFAATLAPRRATTGLPGEVATEPLLRFESGTIAARCAPIEQALLALRLQAQGAEMATLTALLHAPFLGATGTRVQLERWLRDLGLAHFEDDALEQALRAAPAAQAEAASWLLHGLGRRNEMLGDAPASLRTWAERFGAVVDGYGWPGAAAGAATFHEAVSLWRDLLGELASADPPGASPDVVSPEVDGEVALALLTDLVESSVAPALVDAAVTFVDRSELTDRRQAPVVTWDGLWILGMDIGRWPQAARPDPLLSVALQREAGLPQASVGARMSQARSALAHWSDAATDVVLSWSRTQGEVQQQPSPLLDEYVGASRYADGVVARLASHLATQNGRAQPLERFVDARGVACADTAVLPGGVKAPELQGDCAFKAYAQLRLHAEPRQAPAAGLDARLRGLLLHRCLELLWGELQDSEGLQRRTDLQLAQSIGDAFERALAEARQHLILAPDSRVLERERRRTVKAVLELLAIERERPPFRVRSREQRARLPVDATQLSVRIDRVDQLHDGGLLVIDYKSGELDRLELLEERPRPVQLLAYASVLANEQVAGMALMKLRRPVKIAALADDAARLPGARAAEHWPEQLLRWRGHVEALVRDFIAGEARVDPRKHACRYCPLPALCRIDALRLQEQTGEDADDGDEAGQDD